MHKRKKVIALTEMGSVLADKLVSWDHHNLVTKYQDTNQMIQIGVWNYSTDILFVIAGHYDDVLWNLPLREFIPQFCEEFYCNGDKQYIYRALTYLEARGLIHTKEMSNG